MVASYRVIIAEGQPLIAILLRLAVLRLCPAAKVLMAVTGQEVLQRYEQSGTDLIILNKDLPKLNGLEVTRQLRARGLTVPIIVLSSDPDLKEQAQEVGATLALTEPEIINELPRILPQLLTPQALEV